MSEGDAMKADLIPAPTEPVKLASPDWIGRKALGTNDSWAWYTGTVSAVTEDGEYVEIEYQRGWWRGTDSHWFRAGEVHLIIEGKDTPCS